VLIDSKSEKLHPIGWCHWAIHHVGAVTPFCKKQSNYRRTRFRKPDFRVRGLPLGIASPVVMKAESRVGTDVTIRTAQGGCGLPRCSASRGPDGHARRATRAAGTALLLGHLVTALHEGVTLDGGAAAPRSVTEGTLGDRGQSGSSLT